MVLTLRDVVDSRASQRAVDVRRTGAERLDADRGRRERFSLDDIDRRDASDVGARTPARSMNDVVRSSTGRSVRGASGRLEDEPATRQAARADGSRTDNVKPDARKVDAPRPEASEDLQASAAVEPGATEPDVHNPAVAKSNIGASVVAEPARAGSEGTGCDTDLPVADPLASTPPDAVEPDVATPQSMASESADVAASTPEGAPGLREPLPLRMSASDGKARAEVPTKPAAGRESIAHRTSGPTSTSAATIDEDGSIFEAEPEELVEAATTGEIDEPADRNTPGEIPSAPAGMAVFIAPVAPAMSPGRPVSATEGSRQDGTSGIDAAGAAATGVSGLAAGSSPVRVAVAARPGFAAALSEDASKDFGGDAGASAPTLGVETGGTVGAAAAPAGLAESRAATATPQPAAAASSSTPVPLGAVPMTIGLRALGSSSRFEIRLDPKELGRIDVAIDIDKASGTVGARLVVERPETLALLHRDASSLQEALAQTGLDASAGVSLSLRGEEQGQRNGGDPSADAQARQAVRASRGDARAMSDQAIIDLAPIRTLRGLGRIDIRI